MAQCADFRAQEVQWNFASWTCKSAVGLLPRIHQYTAHEALPVSVSLGLGPGLAPRLGQRIIRLGQQVSWHMRWEASCWRAVVCCGFVPSGHHDVDCVDMGCPRNPFRSAVDTTLDGGRCASQSVSIKQTQHNTNKCKGRTSIRSGWMDRGHWQ